MKIKLLILFFSIFTFALSAQENALDFDGINDRVILPSIPALNNVFTVEYLIYYKGGDSSLDRVFSSSPLQFDVDTGGGGAVRFWYTDTDWDGCTWNSTGYVMPENIWTHFAWVNDGTGIMLFVDGVLTYSNTSCNASFTNMSLRLGTNGGNSQAGNIILDEFRIWNVNRTQSEIEEYMNTELTGNETGLVSYYNFNQGIPSGNNTGETTLIDGTANSNDGTLVNFSLMGDTSNWIESLAPLPVELIEFNGSVNSNSIVLFWTTGSEINNFGFEIQRSKDGRSWEDIDFVHGQESSTENTSYSFWDRNPFVETNYYRLKQIDIDGKINFSKIISFVLPSQNAIEVFPNPVKNSLAIVGVDHAAVQVMDYLGRIVLITNFNGLDIDVSALIPGVYFIELSNEKGVVVKKIIKH